MIHHGGAGTTARAIASGVPSLIAPQVNVPLDWPYRTYLLCKLTYFTFLHMQLVWGDQPGWAAAIERARIGVDLGS